jgi:hypothetical protein
MKGKPRPARGITSLAGSAMALAVAMALAIPALAHHGGDDGDFGDRNPAGTIASFDQGSKMLTIALADGGSVSGLVTRWTWIDDGDRGGHHWRDRGDSGDLVPGAVVEDAVLGLADGRAFFVKVDLDD